MTPQVKYAIHPGYVTSRNDGETHFISSAQLMHLYKVNPAECVVASRGRPHWHIHDGCANNLKHLYPRSDGRY